jgi:hypothetical protein
MVSAHFPATSSSKDAFAQSMVEFTKKQVVSSEWSFPGTCPGAW